MINIDIEVKSKKWKLEPQIEEFVELVVRKIIPLTDLKKILTPNFVLELSVSLVSDAQIKKISRDFRNKDKATNVLSFGVFDENLLRHIGLKKMLGRQKYLFLGDVVIAYETLKKEALEQKKSFKDHLTHLILHSILHLIGFDHEEEKMAEEMESLEIKILKKLKIKNPYQQTI